MNRFLGLLFQIVRYSSNTFNTSRVSDSLKLINEKNVFFAIQCAFSPKVSRIMAICHENLSQKGQWCHRRMVAEWLETKLDVIIPEWQPEPKPMPLFEM